MCWSVVMLDCGSVGVLKCMICRSVVECWECWECWSV